MPYYYIHDEKQPHLGGNLTCGDPNSYAPSAWDYVINRFAIKSVLDIGAGLGHSSAYFFNKGCSVIAVDGLESNCVNAVYPVIKQDMTVAPVVTKVDLVYLVEFVEHVEPLFLQNILRSMMCGKYALMTHAQPGQGGHHHVNLQPADYWIHHITQMGFLLLETDTERIRKLAAQDNAEWLASTGLMFGKP